jgi:hypothetical protein
MKYSLFRNTSDHLDSLVNQPKKPTNVKSLILWSALSTVAIWLVILFGRDFVKTILMSIDHAKAVHSNNSLIKTGIKKQIIPAVALLYKILDGKVSRTLVDAEKYSDFIQQSVKTLNLAQERIKSQVSSANTTQPDTL